MTAASSGVDTSYRLEDRYRKPAGRIYLTGLQALVRLPLVQQARDAAAGLNTAGFISGYRGSPLGAYDQALWQAQKELAAARIEFRPAVNEELAATAVLGTQQLHYTGDGTVEGVFSIWYGKGPGLDRAGDALKHGNAFGSAPRGGVLVVVGDDHGAVSSSMAFQSEQAMISWMMPVLNPASVQEFIDFGLYGFALSRFAGCWTGFKALTETVESAAAVEVDSDRPRIVLPGDYLPPPGGLHIRWPDPREGVEARMLARVEAIAAFKRATPIDRITQDVAGARLGIVCSGKSFLDLSEALRRLGVDQAGLARLGIRVLKIGMPWPLDATVVRAFANGLERILVIEEKRPVIEAQIKDLLYALPDSRRPRLLGKADEAGQPLLPLGGELNPAVVAEVLAQIVGEAALSPAGREWLGFVARQRAALAEDVPIAVRIPYFCSGCPHNTSTKVPEGSRAMAGIGCHFMATWMDRSTDSLTQMGGEGANWIGQAPFSSTPHVFQNLGDGTYYHSGLLAIRAAVGAGVNVTYKILYNDAVAMTGGQPVDGALSVAQISQQVYHEGVRRIAIVSDAPERHSDRSALAPHVTLHHRSELDSIQRELREVPGVSLLIYDQTCAAEKRRRRKRGEYPDAPRRVVINELVCEGCGDCVSESNCLSVQPVATELGAKRRIDQSSCNKDYSCVQGFCPSFVTLEGAKPRRPIDATRAELREAAAGLPEPAASHAGSDCNLLVTGVGGTGVVTVGALLAMAAHLEGKAASVVDFTGFAQKGGSVLCHVRIAPADAGPRTVRIPWGAAHAVLACDSVVASSAEALATMRHGQTRVLINSDLLPTADATRSPDGRLDPAPFAARLAEVVGRENVQQFGFTRLATTLFGDAIASNVFMLGYAFQSGLIPLSAAALEQAIRLNGVAVAGNLEIFAIGRLAAHDRARVQAVARPMAAEPLQPIAASLDEAIERRASHLEAYQDGAYAQRYLKLVDRVRTAEASCMPGQTALTEAVARSLFKLMAYKDEYEVARLHADPAFRKRIEAEFEGEIRLTYHLAPPLLAARDPSTGRPAKRAFGPWMLHAFRLLRHLKRLRGTAFDPFGYTAERRTERRLLAAYHGDVERLLAMLTPANHGIAVALAALPEQIRGFGPVKEKALVAVQAKQAELEKAFAAASAGAAPAGPQLTRQAAAGT